MLVMEDCAPVTNCGSSRSLEALVNGTYSMRATLVAQAIVDESVDDRADRLRQLETLYAAHHRVALGLAYRLVDSRLDAEDIVQEAFLSVWRALATFDSNVGSIRTWLLSVVRNRAIDVLRVRRRRPESVLEVVMYLVDPEVVDSAVIADADRAYVLDLMSALPAPQREVLHLAYFGGLSHTRIAAQLGLPVGTVKGRIRLALDHLRLTTHGTGEAMGRAS